MPFPLHQWNFLRRHTILRRLLVAVGILAILYVALGFFAAPPLLRSQGEKRLSKTLDRPVRIQAIRTNPLTFSVEVTGLHVGDGKGGTLLEWRRLFVNFDPFKRVFGTWTFKVIELDGFHASVVRDASGHMNFADLLAKQTGAAPKADAASQDAPPSISIGQLSINGAGVHFEDHGLAAPFQTEIGPVSFALKNFRTTSDASAPYSFTATTESGESVKWTGSVEPRLLKSSGELALSNIKLPKYAPYIEGRAGFRVQSGDLSVKAQYNAAMDGKSPVVRVSNGSVTVQALELAPIHSPEGRVSVKEAALTGIEADTASRKLVIAGIRLKGGNLTANRTENGIDLTGMFSPHAPETGHRLPGAPPTPMEASSSTPVPSETTGPWSVTLNDAAVEAFDIALVDRTLERPAKFQVLNLSSHLAPLMLHDLGAPSALAAKFKLGDDGECSIDGSLALNPLKGTLTVSANHVPLALVNPYLDASLPLKIQKGVAALSGEVSLSGNAISFRGKSDLNNLDLRDAATSSPLLGLSALSLEGMDVSSLPFKADIAQVLLKDFQAHVSIDREGKLNLSTLASGSQSTAPSATQTTSVPPSATPSAGPPLPPISIGQLSLEQARLAFHDKSVAPAAESEISGLSGTIKGLSSTSPGQGEIKLKGVVNGTAPVEITGRLNPLGTPASADVKLDIKDIELSPFAPYVAKFAGYALERGALSLAIDFKLADRTINSSDVATLDQFTLGEKNESPDAVKLPITLAIALLKDSSGQIVIDVPVEGRLDDPNFRIGRVVWRVIGNLLAKAATSPFALLGSMFGGGGEELAFQAFAPGATAPRDTESGKLATVIKAMANRPGLRLDLAGGFDPTTDRAELQRARLNEQIDAVALQSRSSITVPEAPSASGETPPSQDEREEAVRSLFAAAFPELIPPVPEPAVVITQPVEPVTHHTTLLQRVRRLFSAKESTPSSPPPSAPAPEAQSPTSGSGGDTTPAISTEEMTSRLAARVAIDDDELRKLANTRAQQIRSRILLSGEVSPDRVFIVAPNGNGSRVELKLK